MLPFIETKRLKIHAPQKSDVDHLFALKSDPEVMQFVGAGSQSREKVQDSLAKAIAHYQQFGFGFGCVYEKESGNFVGHAGLMHFAYDDTRPEIEIGYALVKSAWRKGYGVELAKALVEWGFQNLTVSEIFAVTHPDNQGSRRVLEKIHMHYVGIINEDNNESALYKITRPNTQLSHPAIRYLT